MLISVQSLQNKRCGVVNDETKKLVVPLLYDNIIIQKYGIVAEEIHNSKPSSVIYDFDGKPVLRAFQNVLLLDNNLLLTSATTKGLCFLANSKELSYVFSNHVDGIMFFCGNSEKAIPYRVGTDVSKILESDEYLKNGAHIENRVVIHSVDKHKWGIWDCSTKSLCYDFIFDVVVQLSGGRFVTRGADGKPQLLR